MPSHKPRLFALTVGIDDYPPAVGKLRGCGNDVDRVSDWLRGFAGDALQLETLKDTAATRGGLITAFREHLGQAGAGDIVLFHYSGHGARWRAAEVFHEVYPDGMDEGLVLYDSRAPGGYDLADKELAVLLHEVAAKGAHTAVMLDCCHSGSGTRGADDFTQARMRQTHQRDDERPLETYLDGYYERLAQAQQPLLIPASRHILLSACERRQKAWEGRDHTGVFSTSLLDVLSATKGDVTYAELFTRTRSAVRRYVDNQSPQFEGFLGFDAYQGFLGGAATDYGVRHRVYFDAGSWKTDCGALHGLSFDPARPSELALYAQDDRQAPIGRARVVKVGAQISELMLLEETTEKALTLAQDSDYQGRITALPVPPLPVAVETDAATAKLLEDALAAEQKADGTLSIAIAAADSGGTGYALRQEGQELVLIERETGRKIQGATGNPEEALRLLLPALRKIATWERQVRLDNPHSRIDADKIDFRLVEIDVDAAGNPVEREREGFDLTIDYVEPAPGAKPTLKGKLLVENHGDQELHFSLAIFSDQFEIEVPYNESIGPTTDPVRLQFGTSQGIFSIDVAPGLDEELVVLKLIVSTERIDGFLLEQKPVEHFGKTRSDARDALRSKGLGGWKEEDAVDTPLTNEWLTKTIRLRIVRKVNRVSDKEAVLAGGRVIVRPHPSLTAGLSLAAAQTATRSAGSGSDFHRALERSGLSLVGFSATRGEPANVLELSDIENAESLAEAPLEIELDAGLAADETLLPLTFDGEDILLVGDAAPGDDGRTLVRVEHIPDGIPDNRRSLGKALKLYFFKTYLKREVNQLRWVEYQADGTPVRQADGVEARVAAARRVLLLIHGIIGDTENIAQGLAGAVDADGRLLREGFDLVLAFDYENLNTDIADTAQRLKTLLRETGLHEHDDKSLTVLAHSMGGLVARSFIERYDGNKVVDHLVMCGTPNGGSPFGKIDAARNLTGVLTTWAINAFPPFAGFGAGLLTALARSRKLSVTLEQMNPKSKFIRELNALDDPGVRYSIIAGDIRAFTENADGLIARLTTKIGKGALFRTLYQQDGHDIAVAVDSIEGVPEARKPAPGRTQVVCHHLNYFSSEAGLQALASIAWFPVDN